MNDRHSFKHHPIRPTFEEKYRALENTLKQKSYTTDLSRDEFVDTYQQNDRSHLFRISIEQSSTPDRSQRSSVSSSRNTFTKDLEIAKLKALVYQKDNDLNALALTHKNALLQVEERMERERKVWNEHRELLLTDERAKFQEEKAGLFQDLQYQLNIERDRCQQLEQKLHHAQTQSSEAKILLKENDRERINAIYDIKEQCRNEYQDEIIRLRNQFQLEKDAELTRIQERVRELEDTLNHLSTDNTATNARQHKSLLALQTVEKTCVRSMNDLIKKLLMAMNSPAHVYSAIPNISSFVYDETSVIERVPTRSLLKYLHNTVDDIHHYIIDQRIHIETKSRFIQKSKNRHMDHLNQIYDEDGEQKSNWKYQKDHDLYHSFQSLAQQSDTVDNLIQKLEDHIAVELDRLSKQREITNDYVEIPSQVQFITNLDDEVNQDTLIRHLQDRMNDLRNDNMRLRDQQQSKSIFSF